jgi:hypothetical protein
MSKVKLYQTQGNVFVKSNGEKQKVEAKVPESIDDLDTLVNLYGENTIPITNNDIIITGENSYAINIQDENDPDYTSISLFPNSKAKVNVKGKEITEMELMNGLFRVETKNPIHLPLANINYLDDSTHFFYIEVQEGKVSISLVSGHAEIVHEELGENVKIEMKEQAILTPSNIRGPLEVEQKFKDAYKKQREFESKFNNLYDDASFIQQKIFISDMEKQIAQFKKDIAQLEQEGGSAPAQMKMGLQQLERQLKDAKKEFKEEIKRKSKKPEKQKELSEFERKFQARERKFDKELEKMAKGVSNKGKISQKNEEMTELERKIQAEAEKLESPKQGKSEDINEEGMTELEKKIQAAGEEIKSGGESNSGEISSDGELTELEKKIQAAGEEIKSEEKKSSNKKDSKS